MDSNYRYPWPGDVLFYRSRKPHGLAISARQRSLGFSRDDLIHAAIMVDGRLLIEARTTSGIQYVPIFKSPKIYSEYNPPVVLRNADLAKDNKNLAKLLDKSLYYHEQKYDFKGAFFKSNISDKSNICSTLVWMIIKSLNSPLPQSLIENNKHVYPAELYNKLIDIGFEEVEPYNPPREEDFKGDNSLNILKFLKNKNSLIDVQRSYQKLDILDHASHGIMLLAMEILSPIDKLLVIINLSDSINSAPILEIEKFLNDIRLSLLSLHQDPVTTPHNWKDISNSKKFVDSLKINISKKIERLSDIVKNISNILEDNINSFIDVRHYDDTKMHSAHMFVFRNLVLTQCQDGIDPICKIDEIINIISSLNWDTQEIDIYEKMDSLHKEFKKLRHITLNGISDLSYLNVNNKESFNSVIECATSDYHRIYSLRSANQTT